MAEPARLFRVALSVGATTGEVTIAASGEFDAGSVRAFDIVASRVLDLDLVEVIVDLSDVTLLDSAAIGAIMRLRRAAGDRNAKFGLDAPHPYQQRLFEITGLQHILR